MHLLDSVAWFTKVSGSLSFTTEMWPSFRGRFLNNNATCLQRNARNSAYVDATVAHYMPNCSKETALFIHILSENLTPPAIRVVFLGPVTYTYFFNNTLNSHILPTLLPFLCQNFSPPTHQFLTQYYTFFFFETKTLMHGRENIHI